MTHPDHADKAKFFGTLSGLRVMAITLDMADHPERQKSDIALNSTQAWIKVGAAPWIPCDRPHRVRLWSDPVGSPWCLADLPKIFAECEVYQIEDCDWPEPPTVLDDRHWNVNLPAAIKAAVKRYVAQAVGEKS
jgi:hypothetical protein